MNSAAHGCHHPKEDLIYERLCWRDQVSAWVVGDLAQAHARLAEDLRTFGEAVRAVQREAELPRDALVGWARSFIEQQRRHLAMQEASFFPAAERALTEEDWRELEAAIPRGPDPLGSGAAEARYDGAPPDHPRLGRGGPAGSGTAAGPRTGRAG